MKLICVFMLLCCLHVSAGGFTQDKITLNMESANLKKVLTEIEKKTSYRFLYNEALFTNKARVNINVINAEITAVLNTLFAGKGIGYEMLENNLIVLKAAREGERITVRQLQVSGKVTGANGEPLQGVSVTVRGTTTGTSTDANGNFSIAVPDGSATLVFSYVGYQLQEVAVNNRSTININLAAAANQMEQIVVVGYGTQRKVDVTGSVSVVRGEEVNRQPSSNAVSSLQGRVAGVQITNPGAPGASPQVRIRGLGTVYGSTNPLYVVDGVWFNDISFLNPADIETISVLKDASSEAIYGIRAANGVVLITTKKGRSGRTNVSYNGFVGYQNVTNEVKMANAREYAILANELNALGGGAPVYPNPDAFGTGTDWYHQILRNAMTTNHQISMSGGAERSTYSLSLSYFLQEGIVEKNDFQRYTARLQNDLGLATNFKIGYTMIGAASKSTDIPGGIFHELFAAAPVVPVYYADGSYGDPSDFNVSESNNFNPQVTLDIFDQKSKNYRLTGNLYGELKFLRNFTFRSSIGGEFGQGEVRHYLPVHKSTIKQQNSTSRLSISRAETRNWLLENTLTYDKRISDHNVRALLGQSVQEYRSFGLNASALNVPNNSEGDLFLRLGTNTQAVPRQVDDFGDLSTIESYFGRINYSFKNRYLLNASLRADGSSKFTGDQRWGYFPSIGAGWVISDESFMQGADLFNTLKLRGSWGKIGNATVPSNLSTLIVTQFPGSFFGTARSIATIVPPTTYWERGIGTDIGLEANFMDNKLFLEVDWYNRKTEEGIFDIPILGSLGTTSGTIIGNQATFQNQGFEFTATWRNSPSEDFSYNVSGNFSTNKNEVLSTETGSNPIFGGGNAATSGQYATRTVVGRPIGEFFGLQVAGIFQNAAEISGSPQASSAKPGDFKYVDQNKDGRIDGLDRVPIGNPNPKYTYGLNTNWNFKQFDLTLDFQGVAGVDIYNANTAIRFGRENFTKEFFDNRWHGAGTSSTNPSVNVGGGENYRPNEWYVESGSYFRVRNLQLGYTLGKNLTDRYKLGSFRVFINAQNAFNFFKYKGFSPEVGGSPISNGIDNSVHPLYATYNFGVNVNF